jgi:hydroxymethylbilane synthase
MIDPLSETEYVIATGSVRRKAQWLHRYPLHKIENLRGNINTRIQKIDDGNWDGGILAAAGLERINLKAKSAIELDWMLPAPSQGAIMVVCREGEAEILKALEKLNDESTAICTHIEKEFMHTMMGGCSMPVSALAQYDKKDIYFRGSILSENGKQKIEVEKYVARDRSAGFGLKMATELLNNGGREIADSIRHAK